MKRGGEPPDETIICQYAGADRWAAASIGIALGCSTPENDPNTTRNGELFEKLVLDAGAAGLQDPERGGRGPVGPSGRKYCAPRDPTGGKRGYTPNRRKAKKLSFVKQLGKIISELLYQPRVPGSEGITPLGTDILERENSFLVIREPQEKCRRVR
jgi:hypothetical protein